MILAHSAIKGLVESGDIMITPYDEGQINPSSYDVRLGSAIYIHREALPLHNGGWWARIKNLLAPPVRRLDDAGEMVLLPIPPNGLIIRPGVLYLAHTLETICAPNHTACLDGKSSGGREGIFTHITAGYIDPKFNGQITLEILTVYPRVIFPGMAIGQVRFHTMLGDPLNYQDVGNYASIQQGPVPSKIHSQIEKYRRAGKVPPRGLTPDPARLGCCHEHPT